MSMNPELKAKWVAALRSGEYRQVSGRLRKGDGFCCLGVLCTVADMPITQDGETLVETGDYGPLDALLGREHVLQLYRMNDNSRRSFQEIADYIEANL